MTGAVDLLDQLGAVLGKVAAAPSRGEKSDILYDLLGDRELHRALARHRASDALYGRATLGRLGSAVHGGVRIIRELEDAIRAAGEALASEAREGQLADLARPPPPAPRPKLLLSTSYQETALALLPHLERGGRVFQRARRLVHIARDGRPTPGVETPTQAPSIDQFARASMLNEVSSVVETWKTVIGPDGMPTQKPALCPPWAAEAVLALPSYPFPLLQGLTQIPIFRPDGSIRVEPGYDAVTGYYFEPPMGLRVQIPATVSREDATAAAECLLEPLVDFPFDGAHHKSAVLAAILTMIARPGIKGAAPLFLFTASTPKSGKTKLVDIAVAIATGRQAARMAPVEQEEELEKRIFASLMAGHTSVLIDNIEGALGGPSLDALLTAWPDYEGRELGLTRIHRVPARTVWMASGNNVTVRGDLAQRVIPVHLVPDVERPELRVGFRFPQVVEAVLEQREVLLSAAYGLLRGYVQAGRPDMGLAPFGGFEAWSGLVRNALVWAGLADPYDGVAALTEAADERRAMVETLLSAWYERWGNQPRWIADMTQDITAEGTPALWAACSVLCMSKDRRLDTNRLGQVMRRSAGRIIGGFRAEHSGGKRHGARGWVVSKKDAPVTEAGELSIPY